MNSQLDDYDKNILQSLKKRGGQLSANDYKKAVVKHDKVCSPKTFWDRIDKLVKSGFLIKKASSEHKQKILYSLMDADIQEKKQVKNFLDSFNGLRDHIEILKNKSWKHSIIKRGETLNDSLPNYQHLRELVKEQCPKCDFKSVIFIRDHKKTLETKNVLKDTVYSNKEIIMISSKDNRAIEHHNEKRMIRYLIGRLMTQQLILEGLYKKMSERNRYSKDFVDVEPHFHKIEKDLTDMGKKYELDLSKIQESLLESTMKISVSLQKQTSKSFQDFDIFLGDAATFLSSLGLGDYTDDSSLS